MSGRIRAAFEFMFGLTAEEEQQARANAGKPWQTELVLADRSCVPTWGVPTRADAVALMRLMEAQEASDG